jgi:hypothetical protein
MERRKLLSAIAALPAIIVSHKGKEVGQAFKVDSNAKYLVFLNAAVVDETFCDPGDAVPPFPEGTPIYFVHPNIDMDQIARIYKISE